MAKPPSDERGWLCLIWKYSL